MIDDININLLIMVSLMAFGSGNALVRARFGPVMFSLVIIFFLLIYVQIKSDHWSIWAVVVFVLGMVYGKRDGIDFIGLGDIAYNTRSWFSGLIPARKENGSSNNQHGTFNQQSTSHDSASFDHEAEQARRRQEAKAERRAQNQQSNTTEQAQPSPEQPQTKRKKHSKPNNQQDTKEKLESEPTADTRSHLEVLGLNTGFSEEELKHAYKRESARCHPDKWAGKPQHIRKTMELEQQLINAAYAKLKD